MKLSRLIVAMIAGLCGALVGLVVVLAVLQDTGELVRSEAGLRIILPAPFVVAYSVFRVADRLDLLADPFTTETNDIYDKKPKGHNRRSV